MFTSNLRTGRWSPRVPSQHGRGDCSDIGGLAQVAGRPATAADYAVPGATLDETRNIKMTRIRAFTAATLVALAASVLATAPAQAAPGDLDPTFSGDGRQITDFGGGEGAGGVVVQGDGKILVAGGADGDFALARYNVDGSLDTTFSGDGMQTTDLGGNDGAWGVALQEDGKIVVAGSSVAAGSSDSDFALARYNVADGSLDTSFGAGGKVITDLGSGSDGAWGVAIQGGKTVVAGSTVAAGSSDSDFALARYNIDGSLDTTFSSDGKETTDFGGGDLSQDIAFQADGKIVAVGSSLPSVPTSDFGDFALARYEANGSLDTSFGAGGRQTTDFNVEDRGLGVAIQTDGQILVSGMSAPDFTIARGDFALARYTANGSLDASFGAGGKQTTDFNFGGEDPADAGARVAIQSDGKIVVAGVTLPGGGPGDFALARYQGGSGAGEPGIPPTNSSPPTISGTAIEGEELTVHAGGWSGSPEIQRTYQWRRCDSAGANCVDIASATATTYTLTAADVGRTIRVRETAMNAYGDGSADSAATAAVKVKPGTIAGTVKSSRKAPIAGATVNCGGAGTATTSATGAYSIANAPPGTYTCTASANGYAPKSQKVKVSSGQQTTANFSLVPR